MERKGKTEHFQMCPGKNKTDTLQLYLKLRPGWKEERKGVVYF